MLHLPRLFLAPEPLLFLILQAIPSFAQPDQLVINQSLPLDTVNLPITTFSLPQSSTSQLTISVALCDTVPLDSNGNNARFFATNNSAVNDPGPNSTESDVYEITLGDNGMGNVTLLGNSGGTFSVSTGSSEQRIEVGVSDTGDPLQEYLPTLPLLGDTTSNQALLFSPPFSPMTLEEPKFPNFTLPDANLSAPDSPTQLPNFTLLIGPTGSFPEFNFTTNTFTDGSPVTACSLNNRANFTINTNNNPENVQSSLVLRDQNGWRTQWLVSGLEPLTNYTAFVLQDNVKISGPVNFKTKSAIFSCPLVHSLPYCPLVSYAVALSPPPSGTVSYDASTLPQSISDPLISYLSNFTTSLLTFACGRDWYSPIVGCTDCQEAYRTWICAVQLPRCGESVAESTSSVVVPVDSVRRKRWSFWKRDGSEQTILVTPALAEQNSTATVRNSPLPPFSSNWTQLLPCLETCNAVERACPPFLQFKCPVPRFNAGDSYGVGYIDGDKDDPGGEWLQRGGKTGNAQDRWGNVWCNGPGLS
ncbi:hypothetical protein ACEPAG_2856 [Sanghuangporus baumii]